MKKVQAVIVGFLFTISGLANAAIVDSASGNYFTDTNSGLDWLDLTTATTVGKSYSTVNNTLLQSGQTYFGWRFAAESELDQLVFNFTGLSSISSINNSGNATILDDLISMFSRTFTGSSSTIYGTSGMVSDLFPSSSLHIIKSLERFNSDPNYATLNPQSIFDAKSLVGSFLVRDTIISPTNPVTSVPEPETYALFLAGLGLLGFAKRRKN